MVVRGRYTPLISTLDAIKKLTPTDSNFIVGNGSTWITESGNTARTSLGLGTGDSPTWISPTVTNLHISSGEIYDTILEADNSELSADHTLTFDLSNANRKLKVYANEIELNYGTFQALDTTDSPTFNIPTLSGITLDLTRNDYLFTERDATTYSTLAIKNTSDGKHSIFEVVSNKGNRGDIVAIQLFGYMDGNNREALFMGWDASDSFDISTVAAGDGYPRPMYIYTSGNTSQLVLGTNGNISMGGDLSVTGAVSGTTVYGNSLQTAADIGIPTDTDILQLSTGTVEIKVQNIDLYQALHSFNCLGDIELNLDTANKSFVVNLNQSGTTFDINNGSTLFTIDQNGDAQLSGSFIVGDGEYIGSASDSDAIQIESDGDVVLSQDLTVTGPIYINNYLYHLNDGDTGIIFGDDSFYFVAGNLNMLKVVEAALGNDEVIINDTQVDINFRWESDTNANGLLCDAGNGNVSINAASLSANYDLALLGDGVLCLKETSTPTADTNYGKVYCKNDDKLYFQDGAGNEHEIAFA